MEPSTAVALITGILIIVFLFFHRRIFAWIEGWTSREYSRQVRAVWYGNWN
jgi:hypothetical protein